MGNKVNLLSSQLKNFFKFRACAISARKAKHLDVTTMLTNSQANTPLGQLERAYYFSYLINSFGRFSAGLHRFELTDRNARKAGLWVELLTDTVKWHHVAKKASGSFVTKLVQFPWFLYNNKQNT